jgi:glucose/mannose-6-phosphate isomerase
MSSIIELRARHDASDMLGRILDFPAQAQQAWRIGAEFVAAATLPAGPFARVVVCGMGGSAIGGDLARSFLGAQAAVPVMNGRDYGLARNVANALVAPASTRLVVASGTRGGLRKRRIG